MHPVQINFLRERLRLLPGTTLTFADLPDQSLALDGAVLGTHLDPVRYRFSFDHHLGLRFASRATCEQVAIALDQGLNPHQINHVFINDIDRDVAASLWLLCHAEQVEHVRLRVFSLGLTDCHGPSTPGGADTRYLQKTFPRKGAPLTFDGVIKSITAIGDWLKHGNTEKVMVEAKTEPCGTAILINGSLIPAPLEAAYGMYKMGHLAFMLCYPMPECKGQWRYTYCKRSDFVPCDFTQLITSLNKAEDAISPGMREPWGGSSTVGGSPRDRGSSLPPQAVASIMAELLGPWSLASPHSAEHRGII